MGLRRAIIFIPVWRLLYARRGLPCTRISGITAIRIIPKREACGCGAVRGGQIIVALLTQEEPRDEHSNPGKASHHTVNLALKGLRALIEKENIASVALPRLATGVGGMDWAEVEPLIQQHLGDLEIPVFVYETYVKDSKADEAVPGA